MYEMLTTDMPLLPQNSSFGGWYHAHHEFKPEPFSPSLKIPRPLQQLVMRCLEKEKNKRPQNIREILKVLEKIQQSSQFGKEGFSSSPQKATERISQVTVTPNSAEATEVTEQEGTVKADLAITEICLQQSWPKDRPIEKIVFADLLNTSTKEIATICVMLDNQDILNHMLSSRYNQFLFINQPHPVLLWITLLYNSQQEPRWLPCYLDLKTKKGQEITRTLAESGFYRILFFSLDQPGCCQNVMNSTINPQNRVMLKQWADSSQVIRTSGRPLAAKSILKQEFKNLKQKILLKMATINPEYSGDISG